MSADLRQDAVRAVVTEGNDQQIVDVKVDKVDDLIKTLEAIVHNNLSPQFSSADIGELESRPEAIINYAQIFEDPNRRSLALQGRVESLKSAFSFVIQTAGHRA
ncbi:MAG: hypothetical protein V3T05_10165 [Myxococcota bacterium]